MIPIPNKEAKTIARAIVDHIFLKFGPIKTILSDRGTEFVNSVVQELCEILNISQKTSTPYRHETVGAIERTHRVFNEYLRSYLEYASDWEDNINYFTFCYNSTPHSSLNFLYTPFQLMFGKDTNSLTCIEQDRVDPLYNIDNVAKEVRFRLQNAHKHANELLSRSKAESIRQSEKGSRSIDIKEHDKVVLVKESSHKHEPVFKGPFVVTKVIHPNVEIYDVNNAKTKIVHKNNVRKYYD